MKCNFKKLGDGSCVCQRCGFRHPATNHSPERIKRTCSPGTQPPVISRAGSYVQAAKHLATWVAAGMPNRDDETVDYLYYTFCEPCEKNINGKCNGCGNCPVKPVSKESAVLPKAANNKLRHATTPCPLGKFGPHTKVLGGKLAVITCFFNPCGWMNRTRNYERFAAAAKFQGAELFTIEAVMHDRPYSLACPELNKCVLMRDYLWQKERLLNLLIEDLPPEYDKVAWVDCDLLFDNPNWVADTSKMLNEFPVVQLFEEAIWLNALGVPDTDGVHRRPSVPHAVNQGIEDGRSFRVSHPGFAWAARRSVLKQCGGLFDRHITGAGDAVMAIGFHGFAEHPFWGLHSSKMREAAVDWCQRAAQATGGKVGAVPGLVRHLWHGNRKDRRYDDRIFAGVIREKFSPERDLVIDENGLWRWSEQADRQLVKFVESYFWGRNEDREHEPMPVTR
jgi:hypothetical protein